MQHVADPGARVAIGNQLEDLAFPLAQTAERADAATVTYTLRDDFRDPWAEVPSPRLHDPDGVDDLAARRFFQEIPAYPRFERMKDMLGSCMHRQDHDLNLGVRRNDLPGGLDSIELRHRDIEYRDSWREAPNFRDGLPTVGSGTHHLDIRLRTQERREAVAHHGVIVGQKDSRGGHG